MPATTAEKVYKAYSKKKQKLSERERDIVERYYGFDGNLRHTLHEIGEQYSVTRERIRQIKKVALNKLGAN